MKRRKDKGITIIVLIITIVVMFILAAVSVNLIIKTDIFNSAKGAVKKTNGKVAETETQVNELLSEWERLNVEWGDNTGGENTNTSGNTNPEECTHVWSNWTITKEATCTEGGSKKRECSKCGKVETDSIPAKGHNWNTETGTCKDCKETCTHTYGEWKTTTEATCTTAGSKNKTCSICKKVETESIAATGHSWNSSTGKCNTCGTACTHTYGDWTITAPATCTIAGSKYRTCSICEYKDVESIAMLGHNYVDYICTRCGAEDPKKPIAVEDGLYVKYDVAYTDVYKSYNYTATNGWRLLHATQNKNPDGTFKGTYRNVELISTGIPAKFNYNYNNEGNWWVKDSSKLTEFKNLLGGSSYYLYSDGIVCESLSAAAGFYYNFGELTFSELSTDPIVNSGSYTYVGNFDRDVAPNIETGNSLFLTSKAKGVRLVTLRELNDARGKTSDPDCLYAVSSATDPASLFRLGGLTEIPGIGTVSYNSYDFWMASPYPGNYACVIQLDQSARMDYQER